MQLHAYLICPDIFESLHGTTDSTFYEHYSQLATLQANRVLFNLGRHDATVNVFDFVTKKTNVQNKDVDTTYKVNNQTYTGYLNDKHQDLPAPNVNAIKRRGNPVLPKNR